MACLALCYYNVDAKKKKSSNTTEVTKKGKKAKKTSSSASADNSKKSGKSKKKGKASKFDPEINSKNVDYSELPEMEQIGRNRIDDTISDESQDDYEDETSSRKSLNNEIVNYNKSKLRKTSSSLDDDDDDSSSSSSSSQSSDDDDDSSSSSSSSQSSNDDDESESSDRDSGADEELDDGMQAENDKFAEKLRKKFFKDFKKMGKNEKEAREEADKMMVAYEAEMDLYDKKLSIEDRQSLKAQVEKVTGESLERAPRGRTAVRLISEALKIPVELFGIPQLLYKEEGTKAVSFIHPTRSWVKTISVIPVANKYADALKNSALKKVVRVYSIDATLKSNDITNLKRDLICTRLGILLKKQKYKDYEVPENIK